MSDSNIILQAGNWSQPLVDPAKVQQIRSNAFALDQQRQQAQQQNLLAKLYQDPKNVQNGILTPQAMAQVMAIDPTTGMALQQQQLKTQDTQLQVKQDQMSYLDNTVATPAIEAYNEALKTMPQQAALAVGQQVYSEGLKTAQGSGLFSSDQAAMIPQNFDPVRVQSSLETYQQYQTQNLDQSKLALAKQALAQRGALGSASLAVRAESANGGAGVADPLADVTFSDGTSVPSYAPSGPAAQAQPVAAPAAQAGQAPPPANAAPKSGGASAAPPSAAPSQTPQAMPTIPGYSPAATQDMVANYVSNGEKTSPNFGGGAIGRRQTEAFHNAVAVYKANNPQSDAPFDSYVKSIANYQEPPPTGYWASTPSGQRVLQALSQQYPQYSAAQYPAAVQAIEAFNTKVPGNKVESLNVGIAHMDTLAGLAQALGNGDIQTFNKIGNQVAAWAGKPAPTNFDAAKAIVGDEIIKAIVGGGGALADRENAQNQIDSAKSPQQLAGVIQTYQALLAGQLNGLQLQFTSSTHLPAEAFQAKLYPETIQKLQAAGRQGNALPGAPSVGTVQDGYTYNGGDPSQPSSWSKVQ